ncbi:MAG: acetate--CoA ligase family protein [Spirochaetes bacterium]|nr:acetate--CoA ligase family protein [Spirochaetota bacterium]
MINASIFTPKSLVIVGASKDPSKIGGRILYNIIQNAYSGKLFGINPKEKSIMGIPCPALEDLLDCELAIICVPAEYTEYYVTELASKHGVKGFIILSAGFSEMGEAGAVLQNRILELVNTYGCSLIGPNCTGVLTQTYAGIFAGPIPSLDPAGCDFVSGSGAAAAFTVEQGILHGLPFSQIITVGNSAQIGVEEILEHWDGEFDRQKSSRVKLIYIETIKNPMKFLRHASSLVQKGCSIAALKAGNSSAGQRAASSHTGALSNPAKSVEALFRKAGIINCSSREELVATAAFCLLGKPAGKKIGIVTHAGGPGVILTDILSANGFQVPEFSGLIFEDLKKQLYPGSSVKNPIDFLATGNADQLRLILQTLRKTQLVDAVAVIFGSPGLTSVEPVYTALEQEMRCSNIPIYPVFPSIITAGKEMEDFSNKSHYPFFLDEAVLGKVMQNEKPAASHLDITEENSKIISNIAEEVRPLLESIPNGYLAPEICTKLLTIAGIATAREVVTQSLGEILDFTAKSEVPAALKSIGLLHKSDSGGVSLNLREKDEITREFRRLMNIKGTTYIQAQDMVRGTELFIGAVHEPGFGHMIFCGLGGIFIEVLQDTVSMLVPVSLQEAKIMIQQLQGYPLFTGVRGQKGLNSELFAHYITSISHLVLAVPEIVELDINPLIADETSITAVDARIKIMR